jgi:two-component system, cell cycle sensor histidine kinase and response regulator CckA
MDICLQGEMDGIQAATIIRQKDFIPAVFLTAYSDGGFLTRAKAAEPAGYIVKPFEEASLRAAIEIALHKAEIEKALRQNQEWSAAILMGIADGVIVTDSYGRVIFMNPMAERLTGWSSAQVRGYPVDDIFPLFCPQTSQRFTTPATQAIQTRQIVPHSADCVLSRPDQTTLPIEASGAPIWNTKGEMTGAVLVCRDVTEIRRAQLDLKRHQAHLEATVHERTSNLAAANAQLTREMDERKRVQEQLTRSQRMEAVGRLSGGIAHDFNNTLLPIIGYADLLLARTPEGDAAINELSEIRRAAQHAASLTRQLLAFSKQQVVNKLALDLNQEISDMRKMLQRIIGEDVELKTEMDQTATSILADQGQMQQIIMNLAVNARDAMPGGGTLLIRTQRMNTVTNPFNLTSGQPAQGHFVRLSVQDSGTGIPPEIRERIFDPFFSTKGHDGTGLGLSVIYSIVESHHGAIELESEIGRGTVFHIFLPVSEKRAERRDDNPKAATSGMVKGHGQRILLVEDEEAVNRFVTQALKMNGYNVLSAACVREAMEVFNREQGQFDMVFSDAILPDGNGVELLSHILTHCPAMRALLSSGYTDKHALLELAAQREIAFLQKPYTLPDLLRTVADVIAGRRQSVLN